MMDQFIDHTLNDRYHIEAILGRKPGRRIYRALQLETHAPVVVKLILFDPDFAWEHLRLFEREAATLKSLTHRAIPKYLDFFEVETAQHKGFALVQSYIEARSLQDWVQAGHSFDEAELKAIAKQVLDILTYLHQHQPPVIHRDLKPSNILLGNRSGNSPGQVSLVDFGSVQAATHGGTVTVVGTYGYMPPEQFGGRSVPASDLYSLGATLIYLATGQDPTDFLQQNASIELKPHPNISASFCDWISWLTATDLSRRPDSAPAALQAMDDAPNYTLSNPTFALTQKPNSNIEISKTKNIMNITVPYKQLQTPSFQRNHKSLVIFVVAFLLFVLSPTLGSYAWIFLILPIYFLHMNSFNQKHKDDIYKLKLILFGKRIFAAISLIGEQDKSIFSNQEIKSISAGKDALKYQLKLYLREDNSNVSITGVHAEIQWLCDEINAWSDFEIASKSSSHSHPVAYF